VPSLRLGTMQKVSSSRCNTDPNALEGIINKDKKILKWELTRQKGRAPLKSYFLATMVIAQQ
jgi:hypothetical protein